jgi:hypothetical protein
MGILNLEHDYKSEMYHIAEAHSREKKKAQYLKIIND